MTLTATLIVKNEAPVIQRCLYAAAEAGCTRLVLHDTGSTDETVSLAILSSHLFQSAHIHRVPWVSYGDNRTMLLAHARRLYPGGYSVMLDADETLALEWSPLGTLTHDAYRLRIQLGEYDLSRVVLFSHAKPWRYEGLLHEHPECAGATIGDEHNLHIVNHSDSHQATLTPEGIKARRLEEARQFQAELARDPANSRAAYYLAQSYQCAGEHAHAYAAHQQRAKMAGWQEESYQSLIWVAKYREWWKWPADMVASAWAEAAKHRPTRAEAWVELARVLLEAGRLDESVQALTAAPTSTTDLFCVHAPAYDEQPASLARRLLDASPTMGQSYPELVRLAGGKNP